MSPLGWFHTACAVLAIVSGGAVLMRHKGTRWHRRLGWTYAASMVATNITALLIYRLTGAFGPFHLAAIVGMGTLVAGLVPAVRRKPLRGQWVEYHYWFMSFSYLGLLAAFASEIATRVPGLSFWWMVLGATVVVFAVGSTVIARRANRTLAPFLRAYRADAEVTLTTPARAPSVD